MVFVVRMGVMIPQSESVSVTFDGIKCVSTQWHRGDPVPGSVGGGLAMCPTGNVLPACGWGASGVQRAETSVCVVHGCVEALGQPPVRREPGIQGLVSAEDLGGSVAQQVFADDHLALCWWVGGVRFGPAVEEGARCAFCLSSQPELPVSPS